MARGKKKESGLTPEEKLSQAMIPDWEWPHKVPKNWCWVNLESVASLHNGDRGVNYPSKKDYVDIGIPFINAGAIQDNALDESEFNYITEEKFESLRAGKIQKGDILYCLRGSLGKTAVVENDIKGAISSSLCILRCNEAVLRKYFAYILRADVIYKQQEMAENGSAQPNLSAASVLKYMLPIPPLAEQQRIVDRIESMFAKLDDAKEKAQTVLDSFETRKAAILHKAFTGELTTKWRAERGENIDSWNQMSVDSLCKSLKYGTAKKSQQDGNVVVIRMGNLQNGEIDWSDLAYSDDEDDINKYRLVPGDVLFNRTNSPVLVGKTSIYRGEYPAIYAGYLIKLDYDRSRITGDYLNYALNTTNAKEYCSAVKTDGVNQSNINAKKIGAYEFLVPTLEEQKEIVRILDCLLAKERQAKEAAEAVLEKIDLLKKSILAHAFRGELGTNDPSEESAVELLKSII